MKISPLLKVTPAHARILGTQLPCAEAPGKAQYLILGGEALRPSDIAFWRQHAPETVLINEYGPTETVVGCCVYRVTGDLPEGCGPDRHANRKHPNVCLRPAFQPRPRWRDG